LNSLFENQINTNDSKPNTQKNNNEYTDLNKIDNTMMLKINNTKMIRYFLICDIIYNFFDYDKYTTI
jgi:hypothetical protein